LLSVVALLSVGVAAVLEDEELGEQRLRDLGRYPLKDFGRPVQLYQLDAPLLLSESPHRAGVAGVGGLRLGVIRGEPFLVHQ
jgi:hypothetical protein